MKEQLPTLVHKFWLGKTSVKESEELLSQLDGIPVPEEVLLPSNKTIAELSEAERTSLQQIHTRIRKRRVIQVRWRILSGAAASLLLLAGAGLFRNYLKTRTHTEDITEKVSETSITETNRTETLRKLLLEDNSVVYLFPGAALSYKKGFGTAHRDLELTGQGRFLVAKNEELPFNVLADNFVVTALGTDFVVNTSNSLKQFVNLNEGSILVKPTENGKIGFSDKVLSEGQHIELNFKDNIMSVGQSEKELTEEEQWHNAPSDEAGAQKKVYTLSYHKTPLKSVFVDLSIRFQKEINVDEANLDNLSLTAELNENISLTKILPIVCKMNNLNFSEKEGKVFITNQ